MAYERKPGDVAIFKNTRRQSDSHPEYTGTYLNENGEECDIALWVKEGKNGKFFAGNLKFVPWKKKEQSAPQSQQSQPSTDDVQFPSDDVPF